MANESKTLLPELSDVELLDLQMLINRYYVEPKWALLAKGLQRWWGQPWYRMFFFGFGIILPMIFDISPGAPGTWVALGIWLVFAQQILVHFARHFLYMYKFWKVRIAFRESTGITLSSKNVTALIEKGVLKNPNSSRLSELLGN